MKTQGSGGTKIVSMIWSSLNHHPVSRNSEADHIDGGAGHHSHHDGLDTVDRMKIMKDTLSFKQDL